VRSEYNFFIHCALYHAQDSRFNTTRVQPVWGSHVSTIKWGWLTLAHLPVVLPGVWLQHGGFVHGVAVVDHTTKWLLTIWLYRKIPFELYLGCFKIVCLTNDKSTSWPWLLLICDPITMASMSDCPLQVDHWIAARVPHVPGHTSQVWSYYIKETTGETQERREGSRENCTLGKAIQWASTIWTHPKWIPTTELMSTWDMQYS